MSVAVLLLLLPGVLGDYVPGSEGGSWSNEELKMVRAKLWGLFTNRNAYYQFKDIRPETGLNATDKEGSDIENFAPKVLRLAFHDCLKYKDGSGGCDGCLNWKGVGKRFPRDQNDIKFKFSLPDMSETNNNGLEYVAAILEAVYTRTDFPTNSPVLEMSLKSSGKSRADLWAFAAKVAVEFSIEANNYQCIKNKEDWHGSDLGFIVGRDCQRNKQCHKTEDWTIGKAIKCEPSEDCMVKLPREIKFEYGRKDCVTTEEVGYKTWKEETHPNPEGNGDDTIDFFKSQFEFSGEETVAIMGAHTLGRFHQDHSLYKYTWTSGSSRLFNNAYYKNIAKTHDWFYEHYPKKSHALCTPTGDIDFKAPEVKWVPSMMGFTEGGGPMHWIRFHNSCPSCDTYRPKHHRGLARAWDACCKNREYGKMCREFEEEDSSKPCQMFRFATDLDEMAMNSEIGLYYQFDQIKGIPTSCPGLENFNMDGWLWNDGRINHPNRRAWDINCPFNTRREPTGAQPVYSFFQTFAENEDAWLTVFVPTLEKMMRNGYLEGDLREAPSSWDETKTCWQDENINPKIYQCN